ncbi:MAG: helix-turn-helix transcriptional regulator [Lachnospiraceae bacterium]
MTEKELLTARQSIVQKLTQARLEKGLSQEQLAKRIGTKHSNICRIEKGTQNLSLDLMIKIAEALDKDVSVMLEERSSTMEKVYSLRLYDETLLTFTLEERGLEGLQATILHTETAKQKLFPLDFGADKRGCCEVAGTTGNSEEPAVCRRNLKDAGAEHKQHEGHH